MSRQQFNAALEAGNYKGLSFLLPEVIKNREDATEVLIELVRRNNVAALANYLRYYKLYQPEDYDKLILEHANILTDTASQESILLIITNLGSGQTGDAAIAALAHYWNLKTEDPILWDLFAASIDFKSVLIAAKGTGDFSIIQSFVPYAEEDELEQYLAWLDQQEVTAQRKWPTRREVIVEREVITPQRKIIEKEEEVITSRRGGLPQRKVILEEEVINKRAPRNIIVEQPIRRSLPRERIVEEEVIMERTPLSRGRSIEKESLVRRTLPRERIREREVVTPTRSIRQEEVSIRRRPQQEVIIERNTVTPRRVSSREQVIRKPQQSEVMQQLPQQTRQVQVVEEVVTTPLPLP